MKAPFVYACNAVLDVCECIGDTCDGWMISEQRVVGAEVVVDLVLFDHCRKVLRAKHKFKWPKD